jgi:hypothetical protein
VTLIHVTCFKCRRRFELDPVFVGMQLRKLKTKTPRHYQAICPACSATNKISVKEMEKDLEAVADQIEAAIQEAKKAEQEKKPAKPKAK